MEHFLLMIAVVALMAGCASKPQSEPNEQAGKEPQPRKVKVVPNSSKAKAALEAALRKAIDNFGAEPIINKAHLKRLKYLDFRSEELTGVSARRGLHHLNYLFFNGNNLTDVSILAVLKKLEQLDFLWNSNLNQGGNREAPEDGTEVQHYPQRQEVATPIPPRGPRTTVALNDLISPIPVFQAEKYFRYQAVGRYCVLFASAVLVGCNRYRELDFKKDVRLLPQTRVLQSC